ncbi:purine-binding chemotaxis protein CheW [Pseudomonas duriflava]|uniref:Purine-binding chemotaxis protein CheW n=1 Tax=Pseudomonas duriflava TaxID=459528 RepID=A0A562QDP4_9PSED|nr:chemotaxis protein CheW [Pseudomonas duriflava]TWI54854.1 purine-binding chemotaxis protein CheW [Pseudomonas duriflava]
MNTELTTALNAGEAERQHLTFVVKGEIFAVDTLCVREIIEYGHLTVVPLMPSFICGVINLRGAVVPVIDLEARFGGTGTVVTPRTCIVILEVTDDDQSQVLGIVVDAVSEVLEIPLEDVRPSPAFGSRIRTDFIQGITKINDAFVVLLNVSQVLSISEIAGLVNVPETAMAFGSARTALPQRSL